MLVRGTVMSATARESAGEFMRIARVDWLVSKSWRKLHAVRNADWTDENRADMAMEWGVSSPVRLACGRTAAGVWIPGMFTRMGAERCSGCCRALGYPQGKGSPKNSDEIRALLGLPADGGAARLQTAVADVERVGREWPDGVHTCAELQEMEPGRRPCTCGRCPGSGTAVGDGVS